MFWESMKLILAVFLLAISLHHNSYQQNRQTTECKKLVDHRVRYLLIIHFFYFNSTLFYICQVWSWMLFVFGFCWNYLDFGFFIYCLNPCSITLIALINLNWHMRPSNFIDNWCQICIQDGYRCRHYPWHTLFESKQHSIIMRAMIWSLTHLIL